MLLLVSKQYPAPGHKHIHYTCTFAIEHPIGLTMHAEALVKTCMHVRHAFLCMWVGLQGVWTVVRPAPLGCGVSLRKLP